MAEKSAMNCDSKVEQSNITEEQDIKKEVVVKSEVHECLVCVNRDQECFDINITKTNASGTSLETFLSKFTQTDLTEDQNCSKYVCKSCYELIDILEQAELEYHKLKETFDAIISKNPLFDLSLANTMKINVVKEEVLPDDGDDDDDDSSVHFGNLEEDSEDEPLIKSKRKRRKTPAKKKKAGTTGKRKLSNKNNDDRWECNVCGLQGQSGGAAAETAHKLTAHALDEDNQDLKDVKTEDSADGSQSPFNNGFEPCLRVQFDSFDDDSLSIQDNKIKIEKKRKLSSSRKPKLPIQKTKKQKVMHQCDECDSRYSTLTRLQQHKLKHDGSKPPYICEICGAHYKHKKACDIHIALHKGIGDWKCEECNRLFPSKNALQRHNNIHTGKLNYQCDLCGKSFIHTSSFKMHKLAHSGVKSHACDVCGLALMTRSHLKRHKRIHSGEKRHECPICGKRFSERYNLAAHSKAHQAGEEPAPARDLAKRRFFRCNFCPERFERRYMLERHMSVVHGRTLERPPPTPRNTMSKLLKAQALTRRDAPPHSADGASADAAAARRRSADTAEAEEPDGKRERERSPDARSALLMSQKLIAQISSTTSIITAGSWSGAYAAEFGIRPDFPH